jgi:hypothetical protein
MTSFWNKFKSMLTGADEPAATVAERVEPAVAAPAPRAATPPPPPAWPATAPSPDAAEAAEADARWQAAYTARESWYQREFGRFPSDILKMRNLFGVWPGGGLYALPADHVAPGLWLYTTFGLSNPDMPARVVPTAVAEAHDAAGRVVQATGTLQAKAPGTVVEPPPGAAGYGYEFALVARDSVQWPLWVLQWAANAELLHDAGLLARVEKHDGLTVQDIEIDDGRRVNLLIAKARAPLPPGATLPNGRMDLVVATVITAEEMHWSMEHGRGPLLDRLVAGGVGQVSELGRASVI